MASPFSRFRKNQKVYLAIMGVVLMIAFVFGSVQCNSPGQDFEDKVVASTKYGEVKETRMQRMLQDIGLVNQFHRRLLYAVFDKSPQFANFPDNFRGQIIEGRLRQEGLLREESETNAVDTMILANKADELGMVVSNDAINDFINGRTGGQLTQSEVGAIISQLNVPQQRIFDGLRTQLLSLRVQNLFGGGLAGTPPGQQWDYYQRLNRRARAEIAPVSVASFIPQVKDPSDDELRKFFEEHKNRLAVPGSSEPGLKQPHKVALQYLKAERDKFYDEAAVTEEQIKEHYEKNKDTAYLYTEPPLETRPIEEPPATEEKKDPPADENKEKKEPESCDSTSQDDPPATETKKPAPAETKSDTPPAETPKPVEPAGPTLEAAGTEPPSKQTEQGPSLLDLSGKYGLPRDIRAGDKPKHAPFWSVKEGIRKQLARQEADKKMGEALDKVKPVLSKYYDDFFRWKADHPDLKDDPANPRPKRPDIVALARQHGLSAHETGLLSIHSVVTETEVGLANREIVGPTLETASIYKDQTIQDGSGNLYLYWKTQDVPEHVPNFDDPETRSEVLAVWKQIQARALAKKRAEQLAEQARAAKSPLAEALLDQKDVAVKTIGPFTWMTQGSEFLGPQQPRISAIKGVDTPGNEFMRTVFGLSVDNVGIAFNAPETDIYVVRLTGLEPSPVVLRQTFLAETSSSRQQQAYNTLSFDTNFEMSRNWIKDVRTAAGLHWNREAYEGRREF